MQCFFPIPLGVTAIFLGQQCHEESSVFIVILTSILSGVTVDAQAGDFEIITVWLIPRLEDADARPAAAIADGILVAVHEPVILHGLGDVAIFDDVHRLLGKVFS